MGLFKSLKEKLTGVSKKLEQEVKTSLEDQLEKELADAVAKAKPPAAPGPSQPQAPPAPSPPASSPATPSAPRAPAAPTAPAAPLAAFPSGGSLPPAPPVAPADAPHAAPAPPVWSSSPPAPVPGTPPASLPTPSSPAPSLDSPPTPGPATPAVVPERPAAPVAPARSAASPATPSAAAQPAVAMPAPAPASVAQPQARPAPAPAKAAQPAYGKKVLSEAEIAARLERELMEAVTVQKEVEAVVRAEAPARRFTINETVLDEVLWDLEVALLESDVALPVIEAIKKEVREQLLSMTVGGDPQAIVEKVLRTAIKRVLQVNPMDFDAFVRQKLASGKRPVVIMFVGVNGTGKTTSIARIAWRLKEQGISCCMAAGDTFRAGAIEQLALHGERLGIAVIKHKGGADPAAVAFDAIEHAKARSKDVVLLDTAGRMQNNTNLMDEMDKIRRVASPDLCVFVGDSLAGNDAVEQARRFDEVVDVGGVILTKVDVDAKGGAALSVAYTINKPLLFIGMGQDYPDLKPFDAEWLVNRLFEGDEQAPAAAA